MTRYSVSKALSGVLLAIVCAVFAGCATTTHTGAIGIERKQVLLVPAAFVENSAIASFNQQNQTARTQKRYITSGEEYRRVVQVASRLEKQVGIFREDALNWKWEVALIDNPTINATCAPGGKITFYTGILRKLHLNDDEIAAVMGHEIAHALREHGRERMSQALGVQAVTMLVSAAAPDKAQQLQMAGVATQYLFTLPNSREHESEADRMGIELAARAGYNPAAAANIWRKMISTRTGGQQPEFFSTHPSDESRIKTLEATVPTVMPLYLAARNHH